MDRQVALTRATSPRGNCKERQGASLGDSRQRRPVTVGYCIGLPHFVVTTVEVETARLMRHSISYQHGLQLFIRERNSRSYKPR